MTQTYEEFVDQIKKTIQKQPIPPNYAPDEWEDKNFNCYLYALRACMNFDYYGFWIAPGFISRKLENDYKNTKKFTLEYFKEDCEALGLQVLPTKVENPIGANEYKIAVYVKYGRDYHFARQDSNGKWSEKDGWNKEIEILKEEDVTKNQKGYNFIGVFRVSKKVE